MCEKVTSFLKSVPSQSRGETNFRPWRFCTNGIATNLPAGVGALELWRRTLPSSLGALPIQLRQSLPAQSLPASWGPT
jgi:hypothetical protein